MRERQEGNYENDDRADGKHTRARVFQANRLLPFHRHTGLSARGFSRFFPLGGREGGFGSVLRETAVGETPPPVPPLKAPGTVWKGDARSFPSFHEFQSNERLSPRCLVSLGPLIDSTSALPPPPPSTLADGGSRCAGGGAPAPVPVPPPALTLAGCTQPILKVLPQDHTGHRSPE